MTVHEFAASTLRDWDEASDLKSFLVIQCVLYHLWYHVVSDFSSKTESEDKENEAPACDTHKVRGQAGNCVPEGTSTKHGRQPLAEKTIEHKITEDVKMEANVNSEDKETGKPRKRRGFENTIDTADCKQQWKFCLCLYWRKFDRCQAALFYEHAYRFVKKIPGFTHTAISRSFSLFFTPFCCCTASSPRTPVYSKLLRLLL